MALVSPIEVAETDKVHNDQRQVEHQESDPGKSQDWFQKWLRFIQLDTARLKPEDATENEPVARETYATGKEEHGLRGTFVDPPPSFKFFVTAENMFSETDDKYDVCYDSRNEHANGSNHDGDVPSIGSDGVQKLVETCGHLYRSEESQERTRYE